MKRKRSRGSESVKIKIKDDKVSITFNAQNWGVLYTEFLETIAIHAENQGIPFADCLGDALKHKLKDMSSSEEEFDLLIDLCERLAAAEESGKYSTDTGNPDIGELK